MEVLPPETWLEVFSLLDARDLQAVQLTCWTFRQLGVHSLSFISIFYFYFILLYFYIIPFFYFYY
jgi:hypothetical protein